MMPPSPPQTSRLRSLVSPFPAGTARGRGVCVRGEMVARPRPGTLAWFPPPAASVPGGQRRGRGGKGRAKRSAAAAAGRRQPRTPALPSGCSPHPPSPFSRDSVEGCGRGTAARRVRWGTGRGGGWDGTSHPPLSPEARVRLPPPPPTPSKPKPPRPDPGRCRRRRRRRRRLRLGPPPAPPSGSSPDARTHTSSNLSCWLISYLTKADPDVKAAAPPTTRAAMAAVSFIWVGCGVVRCDVCCCSMETRLWDQETDGAETGRDGQRGRGAEQSSG